MDRVPGHMMATESNVCWQRRILWTKPYHGEMFFLLAGELIWRKKIVKGKNGSMPLRAIYVTCFPRKRASWDQQAWVDFFHTWRRPRSFGWTIQFIYFIRKWHFVLSYSKKQFSYQRNWSRKKTSCSKAGEQVTGKMVSSIKQNTTIMSWPDAPLSLGMSPWLKPWTQNKRADYI